MKLKKNVQHEKATENAIRFAMLRKVSTNDFLPFCRFTLVLANFFLAAACGLTSGPILMAERMHCLANDSRRLSSRVKSRLSFGQTA